ncbi:Protein of unknown function [Gryllus bimaculatus]|nr:Protein of unknown function [Gryllus bimaculatus]
MQAGNACCEGLLVGCSWGSVIRVTGRLHPRSPSVRRTRFPEDRPPSKIRLNFQDLLSRTPVLFFHHIDVALFRCCYEMKALAEVEFTNFANLA